MPLSATGRKWMESELYGRCLMCDGLGVVGPDKMDPHCERLLIGTGKYRCPSCNGHGYVEAGITVGQVERLRIEIDQLKSQLERSNQ